ncbi:MAG: 5-oxoprolinase subunit PxpB [Pyrinomonadaceae bacterium]|nr:5-oxoprolinase subunit PxpB [Pyrinomonadaceae bacterium]
MKDYKIFSLGENALTIEFGNEISGKLNRLVISLNKYLTENPFQGLNEIVPAYASLTVYFDILAVRKNQPNFPTAFEAVKNIISDALKSLKPNKKELSKTIRIPVIFDDESSPDLKFVAEINKLSTEEIIEIFLSQTYRVYMLGFLPGFAYLGEIDERIAAPRKETPRQLVRAGSVGIAGRQTGIYPFDSPGGWQLIGRTEVKLFEPENEIPTLFQTGDSVKFYRTK